MNIPCRIVTTFILYGIIIGAGLLQANDTDPNTTTAILPDPATVSDLIAYAYDANPGIASARANWRAAVEQCRVVTGYPDPQLMVTYFPEPIETRLGPQDWNAVFSQTIPFPGKLSRAGKVAAADAEIARVKLEMATRNLAVSIRESFQELNYIRTAKKIAGEELELVNHLRKLSETAHADDRANLNDVVQAQSQIGQLRYDRILLDELEATEIARLNELLNRPPGAAIGKLADPDIGAPIHSLQEIHAMAEVHQEEIQMARLAENKSAAKHELTRYDNLPDFKVGVFYAGIGEPDVPTPPDDAGRDAVGIQFGVSVPLWLGKNRGQAARDKARMEMARADTTARINETRTRIREIYFRLQNARRLIDLYGDELIPQAMNSMETAETWFREKEASFADAVEAQSVLYNFRLSLARARADYGKYLARLERLVGRSVTQPAIHSKDKETDMAAGPSSDSRDLSWNQEMTSLQAKWAEAATLLDPWDDRFISFSQEKMAPYLAAADSAAETERFIKNRFSLTDLEILTLLRSPAISAAERRFKAAVQEFSQVSQLDAILRKYTAFTKSVMTGVGHKKGKDAVQMKFPFPGVLGLKGQVVTKSVSIARADLSIARRDAMTQARKAYWNLLYDHQARLVTAEILSLFNRLEDVATTRYKSGTTSFQDVIKIRIRRKIIAENLVTLREKERNVKMRIREILDLRPDAQIGRPKGQWPKFHPPSLEKLYGQAVENRQELQKMRAMIGKMARIIEMGETMILPTYGQGLSFYTDEAILQTGSAAMKQTFPTSTEAGMGAGLPKMPWYGTQDAYLQETRQKLKALEQDLEKAEAATRTMVRNAWFTLDNARREAALYRNTIISLSKDALDVTNREYESGTIPFSDAIGAYQDWLDVNLTLQRKRSDMGIAWAELARVVGIDIIK